MLNHNFPTLWCPPEGCQGRHQDQGSTTQSSTVWGSSFLSTFAVVRISNSDKFLRGELANITHCHILKAHASPLQQPHRTLALLGSTTPALSWRYNPLMTDFFSAFNLGVKSAKSSSIFSNLVYSLCTNSANWQKNSVHRFKNLPSHSSYL